MVTESSRRWLITPAAILVACAAAIVLLRETTVTSFHADESGWVESGIYYTNLLRQANWDRSAWDCTSCGTWGGGLNMHVGQWLIGLAYLDCLETAKCRFAGQYDLGLSFDENVNRGNVPSALLLARGRTSAAIAGALCVLLAFFIGWEIGKPKLVAALAAAALVLTNGLFVHSTTRVMTDAYYNLFLLGVCCSCLSLARSSDWRAWRRTALATGALIALAGSVKVSGFLLGALLYVSVLLYVLRIAKPPLRIVVEAALICGASSLVLAYVLDPTLWPSLEWIRGRSPHLADAARLLIFPKLFIRWSRLLAEIETNGLGDWTGNHLIEMQHCIFVRYLGAIANPPENIVAWGHLTLFGLIVLGLVGAGVYHCVQGVSRSFRTRRPDVLFVPLAWLAINYGFVIAFSRLNWDRYYLPVILAMLVLASIGAATLYAAAQRAVKGVRGASAARSSLVR